MKSSSNFKKLPIILFGNGKVPTHSSVLKKIDNANTILCVDGASDKLIKLGYTPNLILGDFDSLKLNINEYPCETIHLPDQSNTDLEKSLLWCINHNIKELTLIGFSEKRDDHSMASLWGLRYFSKKIKISIVSDYAEIFFIKGKSKFLTTPNQIISIIPNNLKTSIKTSGLQYELNNQSLKSYGNGISNIAIKEQIEIHTDDWVWLFINHTK